MKNKLGAVLTIVLITAIIPIVLVFYLTPKEYSFNEEIRAFRTILDEETSVTFTGWSIKDSSDGVNDVVYVNYTVRNIGNTTLDILWCVPKEVPQLKYGNNYYCPTHQNYGWQFYSPSPSLLSPNQVQNGYLEYEITRGTQPTQLLYPNRDAPSVIVNF